MASHSSFRKFMILWSGELLSSIGSGMTAFGLGIYVYNQTGKASATAFVTLLAFVPYLIFSVPAGVLADRYDRRLLMILGDSLSALGLVFILVCMSFGLNDYWVICVGVTISSVFSSLMDPAFKATISDLLTEEEYAKGSGLTQAAGSARYLLSPAIAGLILSISDIKMILIIDIATFFVTVVTTMVVRRGLAAKPSKKHEAFSVEMKAGWSAIRMKRGILLLVIITSVMTFFIGFIQTLSTPMVIAFTSEKNLGIIETICASGMLVTSVFIGAFAKNRKCIPMLGISLFLAGLFMMLFGSFENAVWICIGGFLFFAMLPFANTAIDVLIRKNIDNNVQGRAFGLIGLISQLGYVVSYAICGLLADAIFTPLLTKDGALASSVGKVIGVGKGRGTGFLIIIAGFCLSLTAVYLLLQKDIRTLDKVTALPLKQDTGIEEG